jgi:hypothetical protein
MTPDDIRTVQRSWGELRAHRGVLLAGLIRRFDPAAHAPVEAAFRAGWLVGAAEQLVGLLSSPSRLAGRARELALAWPDPQVAPSCDVEGRAWMEAAGECSPTWCALTESAWRQAWVLLSDVLAAEALSPFDEGVGQPASATRGTTSVA